MRLACNLSLCHLLLLLGGDNDSSPDKVRFPAAFFAAGEVSPSLVPRLVLVPLAVWVWSWSVSEDALRGRRRVLRSGSHRGCRRQPWILLSGHPEMGCLGRVPSVEGFITQKLLGSEAAYVTWHFLPFCDCKGSWVTEAHWSFRWPLSCTPAHRTTFTFHFNIMFYAKWVQQWWFMYF